LRLNGSVFAAIATLYVPPKDETFVASIQHLKFACPQDFTTTVYPIGLSAKVGNAIFLRKAERRHEDDDGAEEPDLPRAAAAEPSSDIDTDGDEDEDEAEHNKELSALTSGVQRGGIHINTFCLGNREG
jgi:hypothetical protein